MDFLLKKNSDGSYWPANEFAEEKSIKVAAGEIVKAEYTKGRNYGNLQRLHVFVGVLWNNMAEDWQKYFGNVDNFRYSIEFESGCIEFVPLLDGRKIRRVKSISYESMTELEFRETFNKLIDATLKYFEKWTRKDMQNLVYNEILNFM